MVVCLVHLVPLISLVGLVQPNKQDRLADFFSILLSCSGIGSRHEMHRANFDGRDD